MDGDYQMKKKLPKKKRSIEQEKLLIKIEEEKKELLEELNQVVDENQRKKATVKINKLSNKINKLKTGSILTRRTKRNIIGYSFIAPNFIGFAIFTLVPMLFSFFLAFMEWDGNNPIKFVGFNNFIRLIDDTRFKAAFVNTILYSVATVPVTLMCALGLAVLLNKKIRFQKLFRSSVFFPHVASLVAVAAVWNMLFSPANGPVNMLLSKLGVDAQNIPRWAADNDYAMLTVVFFSIWKSTGYYMIIYLAGLQGIPKETYEAASLDGANSWQSFRYVTLPMLQKTTFFVSIILTINCFKVYDQVFMITQGGPGTSTLVLVMHIYNTAFVNWDLGYSSAVAVVLFVMVLIITIIQFRGDKKYAYD